MEDENKILNEFFAKPELIDGTGKKVTKEEVAKIAEARKKQLIQLKEYIDKNKDSKMFSNIPRKTK